MKILKYILPLVVGVCSFSCEDKLSEINVDPNTAGSADPAATFVSGIGYYGIAVDAYFNELDALFAQYVAGGPGVALIDDERYFFQNSDYNVEWSFSFNQALSDLKFTIDNGNEAQAAAADILSVHIWQNLVDHYGPIPYSEALSGADGNLAPKYDDGKAIYDALVTRIDASLAKLAETDDELGDEDILFGGEVESWTRFANSLKLKLLMRQSVTNAAEVGPKVIELINNGIFIEGEAQIVAIPFSGETGLNYNPFYARREAGVGQFYVASSTTVDEMTSLGDPRLSVLFDEAANTGTIVGLYQGSIEDVVAPSKADYSFPSSVAYAEDNDVILMSNWEVYFLRAEAAARFGTADDEEEMFESGVTSHFDYIGASGAASYLSSEAISYDAGGGLATRLEKIAVQKWISMCGLQESEGWIETRRLDTPEAPIFTDGIFNSPTRNVLGADVYPTIRLYPQSEVSFNPTNVPAGRKTTDKVFWDN